jgi:gliding motility-associated-like protein
MPSAYGSHIVGGEINYRCLGNDRFEIIMTIYRDCKVGNPNVWFDNPASIGFFNSNNSLVKTVGNQGELRMPLRTFDNDTLNPVLNNPCFVLPPNVCVHKTTYIDTITLPFLEGGYQLAYQRCCRNSTILNIINPNETGVTFYAFISEEALKTCNTSASFIDWPPIYICQGEPIVFDHSAIDVNGDSLVYRLCTPLVGASNNFPVPRPPNPPPYDPVLWRQGYELLNMLGSTLPLNIDQTTGILSGTPEFTGQFVVGICIDEYRSGSRISTTRRDFQYNVGECGVPAAAFATEMVYCDLNVFVKNESIFYTESKWILSGNGIENLEIKTKDFNYKFDMPGNYKLKLIVQPGTSCADSIELELMVFENTFDTNFKIVQHTCTNIIDLSLTSIENNTGSPISSYRWFILIDNDTIKLEGKEVFISFPEVNQIGIWHIVENELGCKDSIFKQFIPEILLIPDFNVQEKVCAGDTFNIEINTNHDITWTPSEIILSGQNTHNIKVFTNINSNVTFTIRNNLGCEWSGDIELLVIDTLPNLQIFANPEEISLPGISQLSVSPSDGLQFEWSPQSTLNDPMIFNPIANPQQTTTYTVTVTSDSGCTKILQVTVRVTVLFCDDTHVFIPNAFSPNGDMFNDTWNVRSINLESYQLIVYNRWGNEVFKTNSQDLSWDGTYKGQPVPVGSYGYYFEGLCIGGEIIRRKGNVTVF